MATVFVDDSNAFDAARHAEDVVRDGEDKVRGKGAVGADDFRASLAALRRQMDVLDMRLAEHAPGTAPWTVVGESVRTVRRANTWLRDNADIVAAEDARILAAAATRGGADAPVWSSPAAMGLAMDGEQVSRLLDGVDAAWVADEAGRVTDLAAFEPAAVARGGDGGDGLPVVKQIPATFASREDVLAAAAKGKRGGHVLAGAAGDADESDSDEPLVNLRTTRDVHRDFKAPDGDSGPAQGGGSFRTAQDKYNRDASKRGAPPLGGRSRSNFSDDGRPAKRSNSNFGGRGRRESPEEQATRAVLGGRRGAVDRHNQQREADEDDEDMPEEYRNIDPDLIEKITNEILNRSPSVDWDDIAGLKEAKTQVMEAVVWPMLRPDLFKGIRGPPKGLLLFGPPGTGKTMIGKAIATRSGATFFSISASSLTSKWVGEGEKMVRALFAVARVNQPAVIFIDEIDSLLCQRSENDQEASRRIKTEFLVQLDGAGTAAEDRILLVGATNRPQELDEAARRRMMKRLYIPLPNQQARTFLIGHLLKDQTHGLSEADLEDIGVRTRGYSGSDIKGLCAEAALGPMRDGIDIATISASAVRAISHADFIKALSAIRASVSDRDLEAYMAWNKQFGSVSDVKATDGEDGDA